MNLTNIVLDNHAAIVAEAIGELFDRQGKLDSDGVARIYAQRIIREGRKEKPSERRFRCVSADGVELVASTDHPLADASAVLLLDYGLPGDTRVAIQHTDKGYDSFPPMRLFTAAVHGLQRREKRRAWLAQKREEKRAKAKAADKATASQ